MGKILILANNDIGLYKFRKELIEELLKENEVFISLPNGGFVKELVKLGCVFIDTEIDRRGMNPFLDLKLIFKYNRVFNEVKPDLVLTYTIKPNIYGSLVSRFKKVKYAVNITGLGTTFQKPGLIKNFVIQAYKVALKESKVVFFENEENRDLFIDNGLIQVDKTCKLNGAGVNLNEYHYTPYPEKNTTVRFLFVGRIMKEKGIDEILEAAKKIKLDFLNIEIDIVGPVEDNYTNVISELQQSGVINYYGYQSDVKPFIQRSHCLILPSYHEGMSNTLLECGAMGRPLITSDIFGCKEAVINGVTGFLISSKSSADLFNKMSKFIRLSHMERKAMGIETRKYIESRFDRVSITQKTLDKLR